MIQKCLKLLINDVFLMNWTKISVPKYSSGCLTSSLIKPCLQFHTRMKSSIISTRYEIGWNHTWFDFNQVWNWNHTFSTKSLLLNHTIVQIVSRILTNRRNKSTDSFPKFSFSIFNRILHRWRVTARFGKFSHRHRLGDFKTCLVDKVLSDLIFTVFHFVPHVGHIPTGNFPCRRMVRSDLCAHHYWCPQAAGTTKNMLKSCKWNF